MLSLQLQREAFLWFLDNSAECNILELALWALSRTSGVSSLEARSTGRHLWTDEPVSWEAAALTALAADREAASMGLLGPGILSTAVDILFASSSHVQSYACDGSTDLWLISFLGLLWNCILNKFIPFFFERATKYALSEAQCQSSCHHGLNFTMHTARGLAVVLCIAHTLVAATCAGRSVHAQGVMRTQSEAATISWHVIWESKELRRCWRQADEKNKIKIMEGSLRRVPGWLRSEKGQ